LATSGGGNNNGGNNNSQGGCTLLFGDFRGSNVNNFGRDAQYGASNLYWFFGQNSGGPRSNPCIPNAGSSQN
jgi:hypothetical protein